MNKIGKWFWKKQHETDNEIIITNDMDKVLYSTDEWYHYYRQCSKNIRKIMSILENFTNQPQRYSKTDKFWDEMVEIGRLADIKDPEEMKEWLLHCKTKGKRIKKQVTPERRKELHSWKKRAKSVGIDLLPSRRPFMGERKEWEESIVKAESIPKYKNKRVDIGEYKRECINALKYLKKGDSFLVEDRIPQTVEWWLIAMKNTMKEFKDKIFHAEEINHNTQRIWRVK